MSVDTDNLMLRSTGDETLKAIQEERKHRQERVKYLTYKLKMLEELEHNDAFKVYCVDLQAHQNAAFDDMQRSDNPTVMARATGEYTALKTALTLIDTLKPALITELQSLDPNSQI